jgi:hypothetical protein
VRCFRTSKLLARRGSVLSDTGVPSFDARGSHADARLRGDARGRDGGVRRELAAGVKGAGGLAARFRTIQVCPKSAARKHAQALALSIGHISRL